MSTSANPPTTTTENNGQTDVGSTIATTTLTTTTELTTTKTSTTRKAPITGIRHNFIIETLKVYIMFDERRFQFTLIPISFLIQKLLLQ